MGKELISLSVSERRVMEVLWQGDATLMELVRALGGADGWAKSTVTTMVRRMEAKGIVTYGETVKGAKLFHAAVTREEVDATETDGLLARLYHGSVGLMVNAMVQRGNLTRADIDELYAILEQAETKE